MRCFERRKAVKTLNKRKAAILLLCSLTIATLLDSIVIYGQTSSTIRNETSSSTILSNFRFYKTSGMIASGEQRDYYKITAAYNQDASKYESALWCQSISSGVAGETYSFRMKYKSNMKSTILFLIYDISNSKHVVRLDLEPSSDWRQSSWLNATMPYDLKSFRVEVRLFNIDSGWILFDEPELATAIPTEPEQLEGEYVVLKCEFHLHTTYSDGAYSPAEMIQYYKEHGYDVVAVTDHTNIEGWHDGIAEAQAAGASAGVLVIEGGEISFRWEDNTHKHIVALFCHALDSTNEPTDLSLEEIFHDIHAKGGLGIVAHPWRGWSNWQQYQYADYIDGWEYEPHAISPEYRLWLLNSDKIYMFNHDAHGYWLEGSEWAEAHTLLLSHNRTLSGVREALESRRIVVSYGSNYYACMHPVASFIYEPSEPVVNETVTFDASVSYDLEENIVSYSWDFGDGEKSTDNEGLNDTATKSVNVGKLSSAISISASPATITIGGYTTISGSITPSRVEVNVTVWYRLSGEETWSVLTNVTTNQSSEYSYDWSPPEAGIYELKTSSTSLRPAGQETTVLSQQKLQQ